MNKANEPFLWQRLSGILQWVGPGLAAVVYGLSLITLAFPQAEGSLPGTAPITCLLLTPVALCLWPLAARRARQTPFGAADALLGLCLLYTAACAVCVGLGLYVAHAKWLFMAVLPYVAFLALLILLPAFTWPLAIIPAAFGCYVLFRRYRDAKEL